MAKDLAKTSHPTQFFQNIGYMPYKHKFSIANRPCCVLEAQLISWDFNRPWIRMPKGRPALP